MDAAMPHPNSYEAEHYAVDAFATEDERTYSLLTHLAGLLSFLDMGIFLSPVAVLIMWQVKKGQSHWQDDHLKEAMNFQISMLIWALIGLVFSIVTLGIGAVIVVPGLLALRIVGTVRAAIFANKGRYYRYPMCFRLIS